MTISIESNDAMKLLLSESNYAFSILMDSGGSSNSDYADYTSSNFIQSFRHVLQKPDLSRAQLAAMLRNAERRQKRQNSGHNWGALMNQVIANGANTNQNEKGV